MVPSTTLGSRSLGEKGKLAGEPALLVMSKNALQSFIIQTVGPRPLPLYSLSCPSDSPYCSFPLPYSSLHPPCTTTFPPGTSVTGMWFLAGITRSPQWGDGRQREKTTETIKTQVFDIQLNSVLHTCQGLYLKILHSSLFSGQRFVPIECGHLEASNKQQLNFCNMF